MFDLYWNSNTNQASGGLHTDLLGGVGPRHSTPGQYIGSGAEGWGVFGVHGFDGQWELIEGTCPSWLRSLTIRGDVVILGAANLIRVT